MRKVLNIICRDCPFQYWVGELWAAELRDLCSMCSSPLNSLSYLEKKKIKEKMDAGRRTYLAKTLEK